MSTTHQDQDKSSGKPRQRGRKADQRRQPSEQHQNPKLDQRGEDQSSPMAATTEAPSHGAAAPAAVPLIGEVLPPDIRSTGVAAPLDIFPISVQAIAMAYADYTMKSFDGSRSFVEKLMGVRSLDKAIEVQTEFARQAYADIVAESQKMCELYGGLARQIFMPWERFGARVTRAGRQIL
jgi:hypothetical protein